jgi:hypothetical protein
MTLHGVDGFWTGLAMAWTNEDRRTQTSQALDYVTGDPVISNRIDTGIGIVGPGVATAAPRLVGALRTIPASPQITTGTYVSLQRTTQSLNAVTGRAIPIPLHDTTAPWYRYVTPRYDGTISVVTQGRTPQQIARTYSHELQHVSDFVNHPQITYLATRERYFPGTGLARYFLEVRGYHAGSSLASPLTRLRSFSGAQKAHLGSDVIIFGGGGSAAAYSTYNTLFEGE